MLKLTKAQTSILAEADACRDEAIEVPDRAQRAIAPLIREGLLAVMPDEAGPTRLKITSLGRKMLAAGPKKREGITPGAAAHAKAQSRAAQEPAEAPPRGKIETVVALLLRPEGAILQALMEATGWQPHSVRGALSGAIKKGRGLAVISEVTDGVRVYRIVSGQE
jgi:hypothetical protein